MNYTVDSDRVHALLDEPNPVGVLIQVLDVINVHFAFEFSELMRVDAGGVPEGGHPISSANAPLVLNPFVGKLFARAAAGQVPVRVSKFRFSLGEVPE